MEPPAPMPMSDRLDSTDGVTVMEWNPGERNPDGPPPLHPRIRGKGAVVVTHREPAERSASGKEEEEAKVCCGAEDAIEVSPVPRGKRSDELCPRCCCIHTHRGSPSDSMFSDVTVRRRMSASPCLVVADMEQPWRIDVGSRSHPSEWHPTIERVTQAALRGLTLMNFGVVEANVYRGGFPTPETFGFLEALGVKTILNLYDAVLPVVYTQWAKAKGINMVCYHVKGNKFSPHDMDEDQVVDAVCRILDTRLHPMLIHCRSGKHRSGAVIGIVRRLQQWSPSRVRAEYRRHSCPKDRSIDMEFVRLFNIRKIRKQARVIRDEDALVAWRGVRSTVEEGYRDSEVWSQAEYDPTSSTCGGKPYRPAKAKLLADDGSAFLKEVLKEAYNSTES